jgi:hypothetical protein
MAHEDVLALTTKPGRDTPLRDQPPGVRTAAALKNQVTWLGFTLRPATRVAPSSTRPGGQVEDGVS